MANIKKQIDTLSGLIQQFNQQFSALKNIQIEHGKALQQTRNVVEKLAAFE